MFGMGGSEIILILVIALIFLGPDKLPDAAKKISKGIRDLKKQSRVLQQQIENDEHIGGAIRDLKSALRGDEAPPPRPQARKVGTKKKKPALPEGAVPAEGVATALLAGGAAPAAAPAEGAAPADGEEAAKAAEPAKPAVTLPATAGEADPDVVDHTTTPEDLAALIKPASGTVAKGEPEPTTEPKQTHG